MRALSHVCALIVARELGRQREAGAGRGRASAVAAGAWDVEACPGCATDVHVANEVLRP